MKLEFGNLDQIKAIREEEKRLRNIISCDYCGRETDGYCCDRAELRWWINPTKTGKELKGE